MASDSTTTTNVDNPQNPGSEPLTPINGDGQRLQEETTRETSPSIFVNSEPMREDQVQNAVKFLSHPKVRGSPIVYRRSFLEKKGLTKDEIDEAFRRVPDPASTVTTTVTTTQNQDGQSKLATTSQLQVPTQTSQPAIAAPSGMVSTMSTFSQARFHWYHALIAVGLLAATGAGTALLFKNTILPRLKAWIRKVVLEEEEDDSQKKKDSKPSVAEEAAAAAKAAAAAASDVAKASLEMLNSRNEEKHHYEAFMNLLEVQVEEMKSMSTAIKKLEGTRAVTISSNKQIEDARYASSNVRPSAAPASVEPAVAPHPKSYMEIMSMVQRGEKPPGIKDINDSPPNPNQPPSNPRLAPRVKPWETGQIQNGSYYGEGSGSGSGSSSNGQYTTMPPTSQLNGDSSEPLWQQQQQQQQQRKNVRISEIEAEDESRMGSSRAAMNEQQMVRRAWVPPQAPPIAMAEAATAIRQQKTLVQNRTSEEKLIARPSDEIEELQRITKLSESGGGEVEIDSEMGAGAAAAAAAAAAGTQLNEIQEEDVGGGDVIIG